MPEKKIIVAIDGYSSCGKSTMAKALAKSLEYIYVDSGAMYRAVTLYSMEHNMWQNGMPLLEPLRSAMGSIDIFFRRDENGELRTMLNGRDVEDDIRTMAVSELVSPISTIDFVRSKLTSLQQSFGKTRGIVMDGRDIGSTVFPDAELKVFVVCSPQERARRRYKELLAKGEQTDFETVLHNVQERDRIDSTRAISPLTKAEDAIELDNSSLTIEEQNALLLSLAQDRIRGNN
jgi:hypothetical protein